MDFISMLGFSDKSPYKHNPYLDINTPDGKISMADTSMDLIGIDNMGNIKKMKGGRKNPYKFEGNVVREIPIQGGTATAKVGGNPYARGGMSTNQLIEFLFEGDSTDNSQQVPIAKADNQELAHEKNNKILLERHQQEQDDLALQQVQDEDENGGGNGNPYRINNTTPVVQSGNPFKAQNSDYYTEAQKYKGLPYQFAATGNLKAGEKGIDCSGYVCKVVGLPRTSSEEIVKNAPNFRKFNGKTEDFTEGTVIGFDTGNTSFDAGRTYGMDHVGVIVKNPQTGELEYTHSAGSTGVTTMSIPQMLAKYKKAQIYLGNYGQQKESKESFNFSFAGRR